MSSIVSVTKNIAGKTLKLEIGRVAQQASSAVWVEYGETVVLVTVVVGRENPSLGYFPLSVEYVERLYAGGKIKGSRWVKREGRASDSAILTGRLVDRSIRPLFDKNFTNEVQLLMTELAYDKDADIDVACFIGASAALALSPAPWNGPVGGTKVGMIDGEFVANPTSAQLAQSSMELFCAGIKGKINMIETSANQLDDNKFLEALVFADKFNQEVIELIEELVQKINPTKIIPSKPVIEENLVKITNSFAQKYVEGQRRGPHSYDYDTAFEQLKSENPDSDPKLLDQAFQSAWKYAIRKMIISGERPDGRKHDQIRDLSAEVGVLPRVHGSALFARGSTQALTVVTLANPGLAQMIETTTEDLEKRYIHHYNFPPFSTGSVERIMGPKRREIGHGALAEKALEPVIPPISEFPYTIRVVSDIMSSNGSTSQASVSGSTLALMDAGVPIKAPVAGVAMGLISEESIILSDIAGIEDFNGDMDFKVAGTENGITAVQLDVKIDGLDLPLIKQIIERAKTDRLIILKAMLTAISAPRPDVSVYAPKVQTMKINTDKIGEVIGPGGRMIRKIISETGAELDVEDDGTIVISSSSTDGLNRAVAWVKNLTTDPEVGQIYEGKVTRIVNFGAFVEIFPGKEGLVHVSQMAHGYVESPEQVVTEGEVVTVKVYEIDDMGRINLTMLLDSDPEDRQSTNNKFERKNNYHNSNDRGNHQRRRR